MQQEPDSDTMAYMPVEDPPGDAPTLTDRPKMPPPPSAAPSQTPENIGAVAGRKTGKFLFGTRKGCMISAMGCLAVVFMCTCSLSALGVMQASPGSDIATPTSQPHSAIGARATVTPRAKPHATATATIPAPTATATLPPRPTATPRPLPIRAPLLGGTPDDFLSGYGAWDTRDSWNHVAVASTAYVRLFVDYLPGANTTDGLDHVYRVDIQPATSGQSWDPTTAQQLIAAFFPQDAVQVSTFQAPNGAEHVYSSAQLGATFMADQFQVVNSSNGQLVAPGTFDWQCVSTAGSTNTVNMCEIGIGQNYAQG